MSTKKYRNDSVDDCPCASPKCSAGTLAYSHATLTYTDNPHAAVAMPHLTFQIKAGSCHA